MVLEEKHSVMKASLLLATGMTLRPKSFNCSDVTSSIGGGGERGNGT